MSNLQNKKIKPRVVKIGNWGGSATTDRPQAPSKTLDDYETQAEALIDLCNDIECFRNEMDEPCAGIKINGHTEIMKMQSRRFKLYLHKLYYDAFMKPPNADSVQQALGHLESKAMFEGVGHKLARRVGELNDAYYYDLANDNWEAVRIDKEGFRVLSQPPLLFFRTKNMRDQAVPDPTGSLDLVKKHFRFRSEDDLILFSVYLVSCFIPNIPHPLLVLAGEKGAAKSTSLRMLRAIVDPAKSDLTALPTSRDDLVISLANNYMPCFDNLDTLSAEKSDLLCMACTGGSFSKRTLYTNDDETIINFQRCVALNGTNVVVTRSDLMDRSIVLQVSRISPAERKDEKQVWRDFNRDLPKMLGGCLNTLSKAISIRPSVKIANLPRMADFAKWGFAIAEAAGIGGERFLEAYSRNQMRSNEEILSSHPVALTLIRFMRNKRIWQGDWTTLLEKLEKVAEKMNIRVHQKSWPAAPHALSRRMNDLKSNLEQAGIFFDTRKNDTKILTLTNVNVSDDQCSSGVSQQDQQVTRKPVK